MLEEARQKLAALKDRKTRADQSAAAADAIYATVLDRLRAEHQCDSIEAAERQLEILRQKAMAARPRLAALLADLETKLAAIEAAP